MSGYWGVYTSWAQPFWGLSTHQLNYQEASLPLGVVLGGVKTPCLLSQAQGNIGIAAAEK